MEERENDVLIYFKNRYLKSKKEIDLYDLAEACLDSMVYVLVDGQDDIMEIKCKNIDNMKSVVCFSNEKIANEYTLEDNEDIIPFEFDEIVDVAKNSNDFKNIILDPVKMKDRVIFDLDMFRERVK